MTWRLLYRSRSRVESQDWDSEMANIFLTARATNQAIGVTGALALTPGQFVQALEGDKDTVESLYDSIESDPRHTHIEVLDRRSADHRIFHGWAMARVSEDGQTDYQFEVDDEGFDPEVVLRAAEDPDDNIFVRVMRYYLFAG